MISSGAHPNMAILRGYIRRVESYIKILSLFKDEESLRKMDERRGHLTTMLEATTQNPGKFGDVQSEDLRYRATDISLCLQPAFRASKNTARRTKKASHGDRG